MTAHRLVLFDIDGTLLHSGGAGRRAIREALREWLPDDAVFGRVRFDGKTDPQIVAELLAAAGHPDPAEPDRIAAACLRYVEALEAELAGGLALGDRRGLGRLLPALELDQAARPDRGRLARRLAGRQTEDLVVPPCA